jgi:hypothetical protein
VLRRNRQIGAKDGFKTQEKQTASAEINLTRFVGPAIIGCKRRNNPLSTNHGADDGQICRIRFGHRTSFGTAIKRIGETEDKSHRRLPKLPQLLLMTRNDQRKRTTKLKVKTSKRPLGTTAKASKRIPRGTKKEMNRRAKLHEAMTSRLQLIASLIAIGGAILSAAAFLFHGSIFPDETQISSAVYEANIRPLEQFAGDFVIKNKEELEKNDPKLFFRLLLDAVNKEPGMPAKIALAAENFDNIAKCGTSFFCKIDNYASYKQPMRRFWFTFRPAIEQMRGVIAPRDFASTLEKEAKKTLDEDRRAGRLPPSR